MTRPPFTLAGYRQTVAGLSDHGYAPVSFADADPVARHLILRHDVDVSLALARRLAELESDAGWAATYFVLLRTEMYNPWSAAATADLRALTDLGHTVGLHLDSRLYADEAALEAGAAAECAALEGIVGQAVTVLSFHRPPAGRLGGALRLAGRLNAYAALYVRDMGYCSDSRGEWRHGHPWDHPAVADGRALHLLTHPVWWTTDNAATPLACLKGAFRDRITCVDRHLGENNSVWQHGHADR